MIRFTAVLSLTSLFSLSNASDLKIPSPTVQDLEVQKMIIHADPVFETDLSSSANDDVVVGHYGPPPSCDADEQMFQIQGVPGKICAPKCDDMGGCPKDKPDGVTATPQCALSNSATGDKYCVLICHEESNEEEVDAMKKMAPHFLRATPGSSILVGDAQCGEADCHVVQQGLGICTYGA
eukprot:CAMPEP_0113496000 /NCGR_PEP_ID=MMETSP0014_2-20120614/29896_1 /TAXON_ID=2857 /ORGANISM="Nitzschia sp." /LENGTH=179 /DNA_ID=CAMNT_0000389909 /DNA_START=27 /DNA_END=566 /DNA_ORIENTATION=- /assembly_acc=CAM_ASM_000159